MRSDDTRSVATVPNYKYPVSLRGISSKDFEVKCVSQTVDIKRLNLGLAIQKWIFHVLNQAMVPYRRTRYQLLLHNS